MCFRLTIRRLAPLCALAAALAAGAAPAAGQTTFGGAPAPAPLTPPGATALDGNAMWIWIRGRSARGNPDAIAAKARRYGVNLVLVKGGDGVRTWSQLSPWFVSALKARGLRVCGWQFVYGRRPRTEASVGARIVRRGVDCLVIDAEGQYEGRYPQAQTYIRRLRTLIGPSYPLALTSFPYVHFHPGLPYSVFLGPDGAQLNVPQIYWKAIGGGVDRNLRITYKMNRVYGRPIEPAGQAYDRPPSRQIVRFRTLVAAYGARGVSWWDWQEAGTHQWRAISALLPPLPAPPPDPGYPTLRGRAKGDLVVWAQLHLRSAGSPIGVTGVLDGPTHAAVAAYQLVNGLPQTGNIDAPTWQSLLTLPPAPITYRRTPKGARSSSAPGTAPVPRSATLPGRNELEHVPH